MDFSRETLAAFSNALATLHGAADLKAALRPLLADLRALFDGCEVFARSGDETVVLESDTVPGGQPLPGGDELILQLTDPPLQFVLRRNNSFSESEHFLAEQLRAHLAAATGPRQSVPAATGAEASETPHWRRLIGLGLTERECEVLHWIMRGKRDAAIAGILHVASKTVSKHVENILRKLNAENRLSAAQTAAEWLRRGGPHFG